MSDDQMVTIEVDGRELKAKAGTLLIEVTDAAGITIPGFVTTRSSPSLRTAGCAWWK